MRLKALCTNGGNALTNTGFRIVLGLTGLAVIGTVAYPQITSKQKEGDKERAKADVAYEMATLDVAQKDPALDKRVSKSFTNASAHEVLEWLASQGVSFVVNDKEIAD